MYPKSNMEPKTSGSCFVHVSALPSRVPEAEGGAHDGCDEAMVDCMLPVGAVGRAAPGGGAAKPRSFAGTSSSPSTCQPILDWIRRTRGRISPRRRPAIPGSGRGGLLCVRRKPPSTPPRTGAFGRGVCCRRGKVGATAPADWPTRQGCDSGCFGPCSHQEDSAGNGFQRFATGGQGGGGHSRLCRPWTASHVGSVSLLPTRRFRNGTRRETLAVAMCGPACSAAGAAIDFGVAGRA